MQTRFRIDPFSKTRLQEFGGFVLVSTGVLLVLANLVYTPVYHQLIAFTKIHLRSTTTFEPSRLIASQMGSMLFVPGFALIASGYSVLRSSLPRYTPILLGIIVVEVLSGTSLLGWVLMKAEIYTPFPNGVWGLLMANWLKYAFGTIGAVCVPLVLIISCHAIKRVVCARERNAAPPVPAEVF